MVNVSKSGYHINNMLLKAQNERLNFVKNALTIAKKGNVDIGETEELIKEIENNISELKKVGAKDLNLFDKFNRASRLHDYHAMYGILCSSTHNNLRELQRRHLIVENDSVGNIDVFADHAVGEKFYLIDTLLKIQIESLLLACEITKNELEIIDVIKEDYSQFYKSYEHLIE